MKLPAEVLTLSSLFNQVGHELYVVGGAVRDAVLGQSPKDFDVATGATPDQVVKLLKTLPGGCKINAVGKSFGVVKVQFYAARNELEIATFRQDVGAGRRPESVVFTTIDEDVKRRDLTINALFFDIERSELVDLVGGLADLDAKLVRTVGDPFARFAEDRLRILRAVRFACKLGFDIEGMTAQAIKHDPNLHGVSPERIHDEFTRAVATAKHVPALMQHLNYFDLWPHVLPGLNVSYQLAEGITSRVPEVALAVLLDHQRPCGIDERLAALKYSAHEISRTTFLLRYRDLEVSSAFKLRKAFLACSMSAEVLQDYYRLRGLPVTALVRAFNDYLRAAPVKGGDVMKDGFAKQALGAEIERRETEIFKGLL